jgi:hypothetical protein
MIDVHAFAATYHRPATPFELICGGLLMLVIS